MSAIEGSDCTKLQICSAWLKVADLRVPPEMARQFRLVTKI
jgi:hypothetical protein